MSKFTGLSTHAIRKWEQRYGAVEPTRTDGGERRYSDEDVRRLGLIRELTEQGWPIRRLARMSLDELRGRSSGPVDAEAQRQAPRGLVVLGEALAQRWAAYTPRSNLETRYGGTFEDLPSGTAADVVVAEVPTLDDHGVDRALQASRRVGARMTLVVYAFARRATLQRLQTDGVLTLRMPVSPEDIDSSLRELAGEAPASDLDDAERRAPAPPRYSLEALGRIARTPTAVACECPRHVAQVVELLIHLEDYSRDCEAAEPRDRDLHDRVANVTGASRAALERMLDALLDRDATRSRGRL